MNAHGPTAALSELIKAVLLFDYIEVFCKQRRRHSTLGTSHVGQTGSLVSAHL